MALVYDTFRAVNILYAYGRGRRPGTPQRNQPVEFPGIDGQRTIQHGRAGRIVEFGGFGRGATMAALLAAEIAIQAMTGLMGDFVHYVADSSVTYSYCRLEEFYLYGPVSWEIGTNYPVQDAYIRLAQDYW